MGVRAWRATKLGQALNAAAKVGQIPVVGKLSSPDRVYRCRRLATIDRSFGSFERWLLINWQGRDARFDAAEFSLNTLVADAAESFGELLGLESLA